MKFRVAILILLIHPGLFSLSQTKEIDSCNKVLAQPELSDSIRAQTLSYQATLYQSINLNKAVETAKSAIVLAEKLKDDYLLSRSLSRLGSIYVWMLNTTEALQVYVRALDVAQKLNDAYLMQDVYDGLEYLYEVEEEWDKALSYSLKSLDIAESISDDSSKAYSYHGVGSVYYGLQEYEKAESFLKKARGMFLSFGELDRTGTADVDLAKVYIKQKRYTEALKRLDTAMILFETWEEPYQVAEVYQIKGEMYVSLGQFTDAEHCFKRSMQLYKEGDIAAVDFERSRFGLGTVEYGRKRFLAAEELFRRSYYVFKEGDDKTQLLNCLTYMARNDSALGHFSEAFEHLKEYAQVYKERELSRRLKATQRMLIEFEVSKKEEENKLLKEQNQRQKEKFIIMMIAGCLIAVAGVWLAILYRHKNKSLEKIERLQQETDKQNKDLQVIGAVKDKLISMIAHDVRSPLGSLRNTIALTRQNILNLEDFSRLSSMLEMDIYHLMAMLDNTLQWARNQMQGIKVVKEEMNLYNLVKEVILLYQQTSSSKNVKLVNAVNPNRNIVSDREILNTVFRNILSNAIKFTPPGKKVTIEEVDLGEKILIKIKDEGVGINDDTLKKINNNQFVSTRGTENEKGTGLGILFSKELLTKLGEDFRLTTEAGNGTIVTFSIAK